MTGQPVVSILGYHRVGPPPPGSWETWFSVPEETFVEQLRLLTGDGWEVVDQASVVRGLEHPETLPPRAVLITFDDGYRSFSGAALACLERLGYPAVLFVPTDHVGRSNAWEADGGEPDEALCDWDELARLQQVGVSVQSHGATHRGFSTLPLAERVAELERSKTALESRLGTAVDLFAYPYGDPGPDSLAEAFRRAGYRAAFLYDGGPSAVPPPDRYRITRIAMGPDTDLGGQLAA